MVFVNALKTANLLTKNVCAMMVILWVIISAINAMIIVKNVVILKMYYYVINA